jgi:hypothetical protein
MEGLGMRRRLITGSVRQTSLEEALSAPSASHSARASTLPFLASQ